jgi:hypothetical protein
LFFFVVGEGVLAMAVGVVAAAVFVGVIADGGGEGEVGAGQSLGVEERVIVAGLGITSVSGGGGGGEEQQQWWWWWWCR